MKSLLVNGSGETITVGKILCLGRNYAEHAREMQSDVPTVPLLFLKPSSAIIGSGDDIRMPKISHQLHHEVELVVVIGKGGKDITATDAYKHVLGYALGLDMTLRDIQTQAKNEGLPWTVSKGFDTSAPLSEIIPAKRVADPHDLTISCRVNGTLRQKGSTRDMIFHIDTIIEYISTLFTLEHGDLIFTGTPEGVGEVKPGDQIEAELVGFTKISHHVVAA